MNSICWFQWAGQGTLAEWIWFPVRGTALSSARIFLFADFEQSSTVCFLYLQWDSQTKLVEKKNIVIFTKKELKALQEDWKQQPWIVYLITVNGLPLESAELLLDSDLERRPLVQIALRIQTIEVYLLGVTASLKALNKNGRNVHDWQYI